MQQNAQIDSWGVGTKLITSEDLPALGGVYKMSAVFDKEDGGYTPKIKLSDNSEKVTNPGFKNLYRLYDKDSGMAIADLITLRGEEISGDEPITIFHPIETWKRCQVQNFIVEKLQHTIVKGGKLVYEFPEITDIRAFSKAELAKFWEEYLRLDMPQVYKVDLSQKLYDLKKDMIDKIRNGEKE
jgi:nicotinate phosphoribosyltransferase